MTTNFKQITINGNSVNLYLSVSIADAKDWFTHGAKHDRTAKCPVCSRVYHTCTQSPLADTEKVRRVLAIVSGLCLACYDAEVLKLNNPTAIPAAVVSQEEEESMLDLKALWLYPSRMAAHFIIEDCTEGANGAPEVKYVVRHPFTEAMRDSGMKYDKKLDFYPSESSQVLDAILGTRFPGASYARMTIENMSKKARNLLATVLDRIVGLHGQATGITDSATGVRYRVISGSFLGSKASLLLVPVNSGITSFTDLGFTKKNKPISGKRERRAFAPHHGGMTEHTLVKTERVADGELATLTHPQMGQWTWLNFDMKSLDAAHTTFVDGSGICNLLGRVAGRRYEHAATTAMWPGAGEAKCHSQAIPHVIPDMVTFGMKPELVLNGNKAYLGVLNFLEGHDAYMDPQTIVNHGFYDPELVPAEAQYWMDAAADALLNGDDRAVWDMAHMFDKVGKDGWAVKEALRRGIGVQSLPVVFRRFFRLLFEGPIDASGLHIPMMRDGLMKRLYIAPNPLAFTEMGRPSKELDQLSDKTFLAAYYPEAPASGLAVVCCPDMKEGQMWMVRNPNTHSGEAMLVYNVHYAPLMKKYRNRGLVFFSFDASAQMYRMNGADFDDSVVVTTDPRYIAKWQSVRYPEVPKMQKVQRPEGPAAHSVDLRAQKAAHGKTEDWSLLTLRSEMAAWVEGGISLGQFILLIKLDTLMSGEHRFAIIKDLEAQEQTPLVKKALWFFRNRKDHILAKEASNSDLVIDFTQAGKGDPVTVASMMENAQSILEYVDEAGVTRDIPAIPLLSESCLPWERRVASDYLVVHSLACRAYVTMVARQKELTDIARQKEWDLAQPVPQEVLDLYGDDFNAIETAKMLQTSWIERFEALKQRFGGKLPEFGYDWVVNGEPKVKNTKDRITPATRHEGFLHEYLYTEGIPEPEEVRVASAVALAHKIYGKRRNDEKIPVNPDGTTQTFPDGIFVNQILMDYFKALDEAGLTGLNAFVDLDPRAKNRLTKPVAVRVVNGQEKTWVLQTENNLKLGTIPNETEVPDGSYMMSPKGVIVVREAAECLRSGYKRDLDLAVATGSLPMADAAEALVL